MSLLLAFGFLLLIPSSQGQWAGTPGGGGNNPGGNNQQGGDILGEQTAPAQLPNIRSQQQTPGFPQNFQGFPQQNNFGAQGLGGGGNPFLRQQPFLRRPPFLPPFGRQGQLPFSPFRGPFFPFSPFGGRPGFPPIGGNFGGRPGLPGFPGSPFGQQIPFQQQPPFLGGAGGQGQGLPGQGGNAFEFQSPFSGDLGAGGNQGNNGQQIPFQQQSPFLGGAGGQGQGLPGQGGNAFEFQSPFSGDLGAGANQGNNGQAGQGTGGGGFQLPTNGQQPWNIPNFNQGQAGQAVDTLPPFSFLPTGTGSGLQLPTNGQGGQGGIPGGLNLPNVPGGFNFLNGGAPGGLNPQIGSGAPGGFNFLNGQNGQGTTGGLQLPTNAQGGQGQGGAAGGLQLPNNAGGRWNQVLPQQIQQRSFPRVNSAQGLQQGNLGQTQTPAAWMQGGLPNLSGNGQPNPLGAQNNPLQANGQNGGLPLNPFGQSPPFQGQLPFQMPSGNPIGGNNGAQGSNNQNPWTPSTPTQQQNTGVSDLLPGFTFPDNSALTSNPGNGGTTTQGGGIDLSSLFNQGSGTETPSIDFASLFGNTAGSDTTQTSPDTNLQNLFQAMQNAGPPPGNNANNGNQASNPFAGLTAGNQPSQGSQSTNPFGLPGNIPFSANQGSPFGGAPGGNPFQTFQGNPGNPTSGIPGLNTANFGNQDNSQSSGAQGNNPFGNIPFGGMPGLPAPGGQGNNPFGGQPGSNPFAGLPGLGGFPGGNMTGLPFGGAGGLPPFMPGFPGGFPQLPPNGGGTGNNQETPGVFNPPASQMDFLQGLGTANTPFPGSSSGGQGSGNSPFSSQSSIPSNSPFSGSSSSGNSMTTEPPPPLVFPANSNNAADSRPGRIMAVIDMTNANEQNLSTMIKVLSNMLNAKKEESVSKPSTDSGGGGGNELPSLANLFI
ncbi:collagen alpha-5(IV) chain isoform X17 [Magallana gigas]|uniref:collagen alpha-5(IV) chain isoform X17 n=1 Tax=Magallana gigas TaxID=29159 RepID=UPI0033402CE8